MSEAINQEKNTREKRGNHMNTWVKEARETWAKHRRLCDCGADLDLIDDRIAWIKAPIVGIAQKLLYQAWLDMVGGQCPACKAYIEKQLGG